MLFNVLFSAGVESQEGLKAKEKPGLFSVFQRRVESQEGLKAINNKRHRVIDYYYMVESQEGLKE